MSAKGKEFGRNMQIAFKQPKVFRKIITGCKNQGGGGGGQNTGETGSFKCNNCRVSCPILEETKRFRSTNTQRSYPIKQRMTCDSHFVIYLGTCSRCKGQYVGKAVTPFKTRHSNHKQEIKHGRGGLGQHYGPNGRCSYKDIKITLIEQVELGNRVKLAKREQFWRHQLRPYVEKKEIITK